MPIITLLRISKRRVCPCTSFKAAKRDAHRRHRRANRVLLDRDAEDFLARITPEMTNYCVS